VPFLPPPRAPHALELLLVLSVFDAIWEGLKAAFNFIGDVAASVSTAIAAVWRIVQPIFADVWKAVRPLWDAVLKPFWSTLKGWLSALRQWWQEFSKPIVDAFKTIHQFERLIYDATLGPILDTISDIQKLITLSGLAHTQIGGLVVNWLAGASGTLQDVYNTIVEPVNEIIRKIEDYILDINGFLNADLLLTSIFRDFDRIWGVWWTKTLPALSAEGRAALQHFQQPHTIKDHAADVKSYLVDGGGPLQDAIRPAKLVFTAVLAGDDPPDYTPPPPELD